MKRFLILFFSYAAVFCVGYLTVGIIVFYTKPEVKMLPKFIEEILPAPKPGKAERSGLETLDYELLHPQNHDTLTEIIFDTVYGDPNSIFCFRGNAQRSSPTRGFLKKKPQRVVFDWEFETAYDSRMTEFGVWGGGSGWTGQPLVIQWPDSLRKKLFGISETQASNRNLKEVIVGSLSGNIYFLDLLTGRPTRPHLSIGNPIKGTVSADPRMNGLLYAGQGIPNGDRFGAYVFDMFTGREIYHRNGLDPEAKRLWGAFDSNSLIDPKTGYWFHPAENGLIYKALVKGMVGAPAKYRYSSTTHRGQGLEASMGAWKNLGFFADNGGNLFCLDLMHMRPYWIIDNYDDTDASLVVDAENGRPFLYTGNEVDKQGVSGKAYVRKIDAYTGKEMWSVSRICAGTKVGGKTNSGGVLATVLPGKRKASHLVYAIFSRVNNSMEGEFVGIGKKTGEVYFSIPMSAYSWASPIDLYDEDGNCYVFFTDVYGGIYLIDGFSGKMIFYKQFPAVFESSPVAIGNRIVVGSRGKKIYSFLVE
jgi:hypothetical protein